MINNHSLMFKVDQQGKVVNRIIVHNNNVEKFKNVGYGHYTEKDEPQIGDTVKLKHLQFKPVDLEVKPTIWQKIKSFFKRI